MFWPPFFFSCVLLSFLLRWPSSISFPHLDRQAYNCYGSANTYGRYDYPSRRAYKVSYSTWEEKDKRAEEERPTLRRKDNKEGGRVS
jgi:hypothetical protein